MGAGAHRYALPVDHGRDVVGVSAFHLKRDYRPFSVRRHDQPKRIYLTKAPFGISQKIVLVCGNAFFPKRINVVDRSPKADSFDDRRCSRLELVRWVAIADPVPGDFADHLAAAI